MNVNILTTQFNLGRQHAVNGQPRNPPADPVQRIAYDDGFHDGKHMMPANETVQGACDVPHSTDHFWDIGGEG